MSTSTLQAFRISLMSDKPQQEDSSPIHQPAKRRPGRPPTYVFSKPDSELSENERRLKGTVIKRRLRQNRSYHKKKRMKELAKQAERNPTQAGPSSTYSPLINRTSGMIPALSLSSPAPLVSHLPISSTVPHPHLSPLPGQQPSIRSAFAQQLPFFSAHSETRGYPTVSTIDSRSQSSAAPLSVAEINETIDLALSSSEGLRATQTHLSVPPRFDGEMAHLSGTNPHLSVDKPTGTSLLSLRPNSVPHNNLRPQENEIDRREAQLLADIFDNPVQAVPRTTSSSGFPHNVAARQFLPRDIDARLSCLPQGAAHGLNHLALFDGPFSEEAALAVMGITSDTQRSEKVSMLQPFVNLNFLHKLPSGLFQLNDIAKTVPANICFDDMEQARHRFISYYIEQLCKFDPDSLSRNANRRFEAIKMYDQEQRNLNVAAQLCREIGGRKLAMKFLMHAAHIMRYSTPARERIHIFETVLKESLETQSSSQADAQVEGRIHLAIGEAYFDLLQYSEAKVHLQNAIPYMAGNHQDEVPVSSSVLALLLFAEVRVNEQEYGEAKKLILQAVNSMKTRGMQKSTFAVCGFLNLASISIATGLIDNALSSVKEALSLIAELGLNEMPMHADALRTLGNIHLVQGRSKEAHDVFSSGLNIMQRWMEQKMCVRVPFQHCTHLDIFLAEGIARASDNQGSHMEADGFFARSRQQREARGLPSSKNASGLEYQVNGSVVLRLCTRHLY